MIDRLKDIFEITNFFSPYSKRLRKILVLIFIPK